MNLNSKLIAENLIYDIQAEFREKPFYNEIDESGVVGIIESTYYYRILDKIVESINNTEKLSGNGK
jgi:hypothetical protein